MNSDIPLIYRIVNHLYNGQQIDGKLLEQIQIIKNEDLCAFMGLINLMYGMAIQIKKKRESIPKSQNQMQQQINQPNVQGYHDLKADALHLRGEILKQYVKLLEKVLQKPAYELAKFSYQQFYSYCSKHGQSELARHTKGIFPMIDGNKVRPLQFLSFYEQIIKHSNMLIGNPNWETARRINQKYYQINYSNDNNKLFRIGQNNAEQNYQNSRNGIKLCYALIFQKHQQINNSISNLQKEALQAKRQQGMQEIRQSNNELIIQRLKFWYLNYRKFIEEGLQMYKQHHQTMEQSQGQTPIIYGLSQKQGSFQSILIWFIDKMFKVMHQSDKGLTEQHKWQQQKQMQSKLNNLIQIINQKNFFAIEQVQPNGIFVNSNKMLAFAYLHAIYKLVLGAQKDTPASSAYKQMMTNKNAQQQPYNRIFFNNDEILELYKSGKISQFPTLFPYGPLLPDILKSIVKNNPKKLFKNLNNLSILPASQRLIMIIKNNLIGDVSSIDFGSGIQFSEGQQLINLFQKMISQLQYTNLLNTDQNRVHNQPSSIKIYSKFITQWREFYNCYRNFSFKNFDNQLQKYDNYKHLQLTQVIETDFLKISDFVYPMQRPDCFYNLINRFLNLMQGKKNKFIQLLQQVEAQKRSSNLEFNGAMNDLNSFISYFQRQSFKQMLHKGDKNYQTTKNSQPQSMKQEQNLEDRAWKIYGQVYLLLPTISKNLVISLQNQSSSNFEQSKIEQQKQGKCVTESRQFKQTSVVAFGEGLQSNVSYENDFYAQTSKKE